MTGRPAKLEHAIVDGRLALCDAEAAPAAATVVAPSPTPAAALAFPATQPVVASASDELHHNPAMLATSTVGPVPPDPCDDTIAAPNAASQAIESLAPPFKLRSGSTRALPGIRAWFRALPRTTRTIFAPNPKRGASAQRYDAYMHASTIGEYCELNPHSQFTINDLVNDFNHGYLTLPDVTPVVAAVELQRALERPRELYPLLSPDPLQLQVMRLRGVCPSLHAAVQYEALEGDPPPPPFAGGGLNSLLAVEGYNTHRRLCHEPIEFLSDPEMVQVVLCDSSEYGYADIERAPSAPLSVNSIDISEFRSVQALRKHSGRWEDWKKVIAPELHNVIVVKKAMVFLPSSAFKDARILYGDRLEIVHLVTPAGSKFDANGNPLRLKWRLTAGDCKNNSSSLFDGITLLLGHC